MGLAVAHELLTDKAKNVAVIGLDKQKGRDAVNVLNNHYGKNRAVFFVCNVQNRLEMCGKSKILKLCSLRSQIICRMLQKSFRRIWWS